MRMKRILVYVAIILAVVFSYCTALFVFDQDHVDRTHVMLCQARQADITATKSNDLGVPESPSLNEDGKDAE